MPDDPVLIRAAHAAKLLGVSRQRVAELIERGLLSSVKQGEQVLVPRAEVVRRLASAQARSTWIGPKCAAKRLGVTVPTVRLYYRSGLLPGIKDHNNQLNFRPEDVAAFVRPKPTGRPPKYRREPR